nr:RNA recognition motif domain containing protein [Haemonchus contortus]
MSELTISAGEKGAHSEAVEMDIKPLGNGNGIPFSEFVVVSDSNGDPIELPTARDNSLSMATLQASYPGATGMKYKNPKTGALRAVAVDSSGTKLLPPLDGWDDKVFMVITSNTRAERGSDVSVKRRKIGTSDGESDSDGEGRVGRKRAADARDSISQPVKPRRPVDLIVLGVNYKTTDEDFKKYFGTFGTVTFAEIKRNADGSSKGYGFFRMSTVEEEDKVLGFCDHTIDGRRCEIRFPDQKHTDSSGNPLGPPRKTLANKIFVGRLTEKITEETLRDFFNKEAKEVKEAASVAYVHIPRPFRGYAFVSFTHAEVADEMVKASNFVIDGLSVVVTYAVPRESHLAGANLPSGYSNDFGSAYGYGKDGAAYDEAPLGLIPFATREMFGYSPLSGMYPRPSHEGWATPPANMQGTPRSGRGAVGHDQPRYF